MESKKEMKANKDMAKKSLGRSGPVSVAIALVIVAAVGLWFYSGNIKVFFNDTSVKIEASYWADIEVSYAEIDTVTYREDLDVGARKIGIGTARLSVGTFQNDEFGSYALYADADATAFIVLTSDEQTIVIGLNNAEDTQTIYNTLKESVGN